MSWNLPCVCVCDSICAITIPPFTNKENDWEKLSRLHIAGGTHWEAIAGKAVLLHGDLPQADAAFQVFWVEGFVLNTANVSARDGLLAPVAHRPRLLVVVGLAVRILLKHEKRELLGELALAHPANKARRVVGRPLREHARALDLL